jgi:hypothetical protein
MFQVIKSKKPGAVALARRVGAVATLGLIAAGNAMAQTDADIGVTAINGLAAKATLYIAAAFAVAVLVAGGFWGSGPEGRGSLRPFFSFLGYANDPIPFDNTVLAAYRLVPWSCFCPGWHRCCHE